MPALIAAHRLHQYEPIIAAMHAGDIKLFSDTMDTQQFRFIQEARLPACHAIVAAPTAASLWLTARCSVYSKGSLTKF